MTAPLRPLYPGTLVRCSPGGLPFFDDPRMTPGPSAFMVGDFPFMVLAVLYGPKGFEHALVLYGEDGEGRTGWCWGGYLEPVDA